MGSCVSAPDWRWINAGRARRHRIALVEQDWMFVASQLEQAGLRRGFVVKLRAAPSSADFHQLEAPVGSCQLPNASGLLSHEYAPSRSMTEHHQDSIATSQTGYLSPDAYRRTLDIALRVQPAARCWLGSVVSID